MCKTSFRLRVNDAAREFERYLPGGVRFLADTTGYATMWASRSPWDIAGQNSNAKRYRRRNWVSVVVWLDQLLPSAWWQRRNWTPMTPPLMPNDLY